MTNNSPETVNSIAVDIGENFAKAKERLILGEISVGRWSNRCRNAATPTKGALRFD